MVIWQWKLVLTLCNQFGSYFAHQILGEEGLAALLVNTSPQGKPDDDSDDDLNCTDVGPDIDEDELLAQKIELKRDFILKFSLLSYELILVNIRANISTIGIIITIIIRLTLWRSVDQQGSQSLFTKPFSGEMCSKLVAESVSTCFLYCVTI